MPEFCSLQVLLVPFQALLSAFALSVQALPPPAESCYCQTLGVEEQEGMPSALVKHLQMHGTFIFFNYRMLFFFFLHAGTDTGKLLADGASLKRSPCKLCLFV